ncbi:MAG: efflux transporter outer membrane subunit [Proteobacteria bacterium]|nr:efflux transporter outer membrane subunit [Pseudomonadota bacterium]
MQQTAGRESPQRWQHLPRALVGALVLVLAGCAIAPRVPRPHLALPPHYTQAPAATALGPAPDLAHWWRSFHDPVLDALVQRALAQNLGLKAAGERLAAARALLGTPRDRHLPSASLYTNEQPTPGSTASYFQIGFDAIWQFGLFGRGESEQRIADGNANLAAADLAAAHAALVAEVVRSYLDLRAAEQRAQLAVDMRRIARRRAQLIAVRVAQHLDAPAANAGARAGVAEAAAAVTSAESAAAIARQQLAVLLSETTPDAALSAAGPLPLPPALPPQLPPANLLRTRPDIQRAEAAVLHAAGELGIARSNLYPRLGLGWTATASAQTAGGEIGRLRTIPSFGPIINMPLFDWGLRQAQIRANGHQLKAAVLDYRQTVLAAVGEVEQAYAALRSAQAQAVAAQLSAQAAQQAAQAATTRSALGLGDGLAAGSAADAALRARSVASGAQAAEGVAWVRLYKALGGASPLAGSARERSPARAAR